MNVKLRLKLFNIVIPPTVMYILETCPLNKANLQQLEVAQRKMLWIIIGWIFESDDTWEDAGRRMKF